MDPVAAYRAMWSSFRNREYADALEYAESCIAWIDRGGFKPTSIPAFEAECCHVADQCQRAFDRAASAALSPFGDD